MDSYDQILERLAGRARQLRLIQGLQQSDVATRAGLSKGTVQRFETTGRASIENVLRIAMVLRAEGDFDRLFELPKYRSLDEALARPSVVERKRVRRRAL